MKLKWLLSIIIYVFSSQVLAQYKVAALYWSMKIEGQVIMRKGLEESLEAYNKSQTNKQKKIELIPFVAGEGSQGVQNQYKQFKEAIEQNPDLIIIQPTDNAVLSEGLKIANQKNIPVVVYDQYIVDGHMSAMITSDNFGAGWNNGIYISELFDDNKEIKIVVFQYSRISGTTERVDGFLSSLRKRGQKFKVLQKYEAVDPVSGKIAAENFLKDFPEKNSVDVIFTVNDGGGNTIVDILSAANRNELIHATVDGDPVAIENLKNNRLTVVNAAQYCAEIGRQSFKTALQILQKKPYQSKVFIPTYTIHKNSLKDYPGWSGRIVQKNLQVDIHQKIATKPVKISEMTIGVESVCPYICEKNNQWTGYIADLILEYAKKENIKIKFKTIPVNRHVLSIENKQVDTVVTQLNLVRFHPRIQSIGKPIGVAYAGLMAKKETKYTVVASADDIKSFRIGMGPQSSSYLSEEMNQKDFRVTHIVGNDSASRLLKMLDVGRVDYIVDDFSILKSLNYDSKKYRITPASITGFNSISFASLMGHPTANQFANEISDWIEDKRKDESLQKILNKYGISDWDFVLR